MHHFFVEPSQITGTDIFLEGGDVNHIRNVLRMEAGERITVGDGQGKIYQCRIVSVAKDKIQAAIEGVEDGSSELPAKIFLFQGLPKSDKMEWIIQKAVELGVYEVIPVASKRAVVKLDEKKEKAKLARWRAICEGAAKQSGRTRIPEVTRQMTFAQALAYAGDIDVKLIPYELAGGMQTTRELLGGIRPGQSAAIFIGPEGGFAEEEIQFAQESGFVPVTLGKRILRTETAGLYVLSVLGYLLEGE